MRPEGERLDPLGAPDDKTHEITDKSDCNTCDSLQNSLFTLTTHLAQVQLRLRQILNSPSENQENLLKSLEEFAFADANLVSEGVEKRRDQRQALLGKLKLQLEELREFDPTYRRESWICKCFTPRGDHWINLRLKLDSSITDLVKMLQVKENSRKITAQVRKNLAVSIRDLMQHGTKSTHGWSIVVHYYNLQRGDDFNSQTFRKLSRSFNLDIAGVSPETVEKNLLCVIGEIISSHSRYKRSNDSHFKAFVCAGLNSKRLVTWLGLIFRCGDLVETFYYPWSYVAETRYEDGLKSLDALMGFNFDLPVDLDVRKFQIEDDFFV